MSHLRLRAAQPADATELCAIYAPYVEFTTISFEYIPPTTEVFRDRIVRTMEQYPWLVAERDGVIEGYAYAHRLGEREAFTWSAELSIYLRPEAERCGIGTRLYRALCTLLHEQNVAAVYACITVPNTTSVQFHEAFGFRRLGVFPHAGFKMGSWHDIIWMECPLRERASPPQPFVPYPALDRARVEKILSEN